VLDRRPLAAVDVIRYVIGTIRNSASAVNRRPVAVSTMPKAT